jgi:glutamate--cysteine ligase
LVKPLDECLAHFGLPEFRREWGAIRRGIEKESLRVTPAGRLAQTDHPSALGSALTNPYITTDFSEALLEFITPTRDEIADCLAFLQAIHQFTYRRLPDSELLWVCSMPCPTGKEEDIPLARYGSSNIGRLKNLYRKGLSHRYGRLMQTIAGIHYNFSMPEDFWSGYQQLLGDTGPLQDFRTDRYLHLIRNFHRYSWLLLYLFGASPVASKSFVKGRDHHLREFDDTSLYLPNATCLRMSNLGYRSEAQKSLFVCYNELGSYIDSLNTAMHTPYAPYQAIGTRSNGEFLQINTNLLQLENEFYSSVRPKRAVKRGERPITALTRDGIEYIEVRALDLNPFVPLGIDAEQIRFLDAFLLYCLLSDSPACDQREYFQVSHNIEAVVEHGRDPQLKLSRNGDEILMRDWAASLLHGIDFSAGLLDDTHGTGDYSASLARQLAKLENPALTPSGRILSSMENRGQSFFEFAMELSRQHQATLTASAADPALTSILEAASAASLLEQQHIENSDTMDFDTFVTQWNQF